MFRFCATIFTLIGLAGSAYGEVRAVRSPDGRALACLVPRGAPKVLMTEVWLVRAEGASPGRVGLYLGEPGDVGFLPDGRGLVYLERGLSYVAFGANLAPTLAPELGVQRRLPFVKNRIWRLDGSGEALWPLPEGMDPLEMAVAPDGSRLAVVDDRGLWAVDRAGHADLLLEGGVAGPLQWAAGSDAVLCTVDGGTRAVGLDRAVPPAAWQWVGAEVVKDLGLTFPKDGLAKAALPRVRHALNWWVRGHHAMHRDEYRSARQAFREAVSGFKKIKKEFAGRGLSGGSCSGYVAAIEARIADDRVLEEAISGEHMVVLGDLLAQYSLANGSRLPPDLDVFYRWVADGIAQAGDGQARARNQAALDRMMRFPIASGEHLPGAAYTFRSDAVPGTPLLTCYWHRGRVLYLVERTGGLRLEARDIRPDQVDSLFAVGMGLLAHGEAERAIFPLRVVAFQRPEDKDAHVQLGHAFLKIKDYEGAKWAFKRAISLSKDDPEPYYGLGLVLMEMPNERYSAIAYFQRALMRDRGFVDARYQIAFVRYMLNEHDVKPELERVLEMDPTYADAYLLMGDWYANFMEDYEQAIVWYTKFLAMRPEDPKGSRRLGYAYLQVKDYDRILEKLERFIQEYPNAVELMPIVAQACVKRGRYDMAMGFFSSYVSGLNPEERAHYTDIRLIASPEETAEYEGLEGADREAFLERFWNGRDPDITTPVNERLLEHYRRVWFARTEFSRGKEPWDRRGEVYIRFGEPDHVSSSRMLNATQNLAVLRVKERLAASLYGADIVGESFMGPVFPVRNFSLRRDALAFESAPADISIEGERDAFSGAASEGDTDLRQMTTQEASRDGSTQADRGGRGGTGAGAAIGEAGDIGQSTGGLAVGGFQESRINSTPFAAAGFNPGLTAGADLGSVPWETWTYLKIDGGIEITFTDEFNSGVFDFAPVPNAPEVQVEQLAKLWRFSPQKTFQQAVALSPDFFAPEYNETPFDFYYTLADFRGAAGRSALEVYYGIPVPPDCYAAESDQTRLAVSHHLALLSATSDTVYRRRGDLFYQRQGNQTGPGAILPDAVRLEVPPGVYRLEVKARDRLSGRLGIYRQQVVVEDYSEQALRVSDLELAFRVSEAEAEGTFGKQGLHVIPMASRTYRSGQNVFVYYEIYNLKKDEFGQTRYKVEYTMGPKSGGVLAKIVHILTGKKRKEGVAVGYEQVGSEESEAVYTELDLGEARSGRHYLTVAVTDLVGGNSYMKETTFVVAK